LAADFKGQDILVPEFALQPLGKEHYYLFQLSGCAVVTKDGEEIGLVKDILFVNENDLIVVEKGEREIFIPFSESICIGVDLAKKEIVIDPPEGLLDLNEI
jgi:16S rRNA processing protein RimM